MARLAAIMFRGLARACAWLLVLFFVEIGVFLAAAMAGVDILPEGCAGGNIVPHIECDGPSVAGFVEPFLNIPLFLFFYVPSLFYVFAQVDISRFPFEVVPWAVLSMTIWGLGLLYCFKLRRSRARPGR